MDAFAHPLVVLYADMMSEVGRFCLLSHLYILRNTIASMVKVSLVPSMIVSSGLNEVSVFCNLT